MHRARNQEHAQRTKETMWPWGLVLAFGDHVRRASTQSAVPVVVCQLRSYIDWLAGAWRWRKIPNMLPRHNGFGTSLRRLYLTRSWWWLPRLQTHPILARITIPSRARIKDSLMYDSRSLPWGTYISRHACIVIRGGIVDPLLTGWNKARRSPLNHQTIVELVHLNNYLISKVFCFNELLDLERGRYCS